jgi:hypothetical protein
MFINHLQDYKIYATLTKMFISKFLSSLPQPHGQKFDKQKYQNMISLVVQLSFRISSVHENN